MKHTCTKRAAHGLDEHGVALPLALFGLVAVSLMVTSALLTSSTELAISSAHQDATRGLYAADEALEQFVAQRAALVSGTNQRLVNGTFSSYAGGAAFNVEVAELYRTPMTELPNGSVFRRETYSLLTEPQSGRGRAVGALIEATRTAVPVKLNVDSGLTLGVNTTVSGNATISDGSSAGAACDSAAASAAIHHSADTEINTQGNAADIIGAIYQDTRGAEELMSYILDGSTIEDLIDLATIKFGPMYGQPGFTNADGPKWDATNVKYRWGCPALLVTGCSAAQAAYFPVVAIDANGGTVEITGEHAQGMIIVKNGSINIRGNFKFQGIILVEGTLRVSGTPRLEGAVIAMGDEAVIDDDALTSGNSVIRFNKCEIVNAQQALTVAALESSDQLLSNSTFAWFEVVR